MCLLLLHFSLISKDLLLQAQSCTRLHPCIGVVGTLVYVYDLPHSWVF